MTSQIRKIAIVGAGIAGLSLATLAIKRGFEVTVYERNRQLSSMGAGVTLWPNAMYVLHQMGLAEEVERVGGAPDFMRQYDFQGDLRGAFDIRAVNALSGYGSVTVLRGDLMRMLGRQLAALVGRVHFGCTVTREKIDQLQQSVDLVIGADGRMNSVVRQVLYPEPVKPRYQGFINIIGISQPGDNTLDNAIQDIRGQHQRFGVVPVNNGRCYWAAAWSAEMNTERPLSDWYEEMRQRFADWCEPVGRVLISSQASSLNRIFVHDLDPLPYWHKGKLMILGDAAHAPLPTSGQGACQALEDAWHLSCLLEERSDLDTVLSDFYQLRIAKVSAAQNVGRQLAQRIFSPGFEPETSAPVMSPRQLSEFWMQGLGRAQRLPAKNIRCEQVVDHCSSP